MNQESVWSMGRSGSSRRDFLRGSAGASAAAGAGLVLGGAGLAHAGKPTALPPNLPGRVAKPAPGSKAGLAAQELAKVKAQRAGTVAAASSGSSKTSSGFPELYPGLNRSLFSEIQLDEDSHVAFLNGALGSNARPEPTFQDLEASSVDQFVQMAVTFENVGAMTYVTAAVYINSPLILFNSARIATVEGRHAGWLNSLVSEPLVPDFLSLETPLTQQQTATDVMPYIASLNGGPTPGYALARSDANDINILNFALLLEYLEATFYNINVPKFFPAGS